MSIPDAAKMHSPDFNLESFPHLFPEISKYFFNFIQLPDKVENHFKLGLIKNTMWALINPYWKQLWEILNPIHVGTPVITIFIAGIPTIRSHGWFMT